MSSEIRLGRALIELKRRGRNFLGLGRISISGKTVRSGELPLRPFTATHCGIEFDRYEIEGVESSCRRVVIRTKAIGTAAKIAALLDHSLDPVWSTRPWDGAVLAEDSMDWILEAATKDIGGICFEGFSYKFRFRSPKNEIYYILDRATWELDGRAEGLTLLRQQMGEDPKVKLRAGTDYSTSAVIGYPINPVMTHDVPRWASEQGFDFQYRGEHALIGLFEHCGLIRSVIARGSGDSTVRHFDKHIFDQSNDASTVGKFIGLAAGIGSETDQINAWTSVFDADQDNVLGEFGMRRTYPRSTLSHNFWVGFDAGSYRKDLLPAAAALGFQQVFIDPIWENDMTRKREGTIPDWYPGNMCCPHEYEVAKVLGGAAAYRGLAADAKKAGLSLISWIGSHQSFLSKYLISHPAEIIKSADGRHWYGSGYDCIYGMDVSSPFGEMFKRSVLKGAKAAGVEGFLYDSFYNFAWMPVNFHSPDLRDKANIHKGALKVHTQWRQLCAIMAAWQKAGLHMLIESLGPWGQPQHGVQGAYDSPDSTALAYQCSLSIGYSVIPAPSSSDKKRPASTGELYYRFLSQKAPPTLSLFQKDHAGCNVRIDTAADPLVRRSNLDYRKVLRLMHSRTVLDGGGGVLWAPEKGRARAFFSYRRQRISAAGKKGIFDVTEARSADLGRGSFTAEPFHTYIWTE